MTVSADMKPIRYLRPVCFALRWLCLIVAALTLVFSVGVAAAIPLARTGVGYEMKLGQGAEPSFRKVERGAPRDAGKNRLAFTVSGDPVSPAALAGILAAAIPALLGLVWGLWNGASLFKHLGRGEYFARRTVGALRNFAIGLLIYKLAPLAAWPFIAAANRKPATGLKFSLDFNVMQMDGLLTVIFLGMVVVFAHIMTKATEIAEDNAQIV